MISYIRTISGQRAAWLLLAASTMIFEFCGLFFQHVMGLSPCVMCVYERLAFIGILIAAGLALLAPQKPWLRWPALLLWTYSAFRGLQLSLKHVSYQLDPSPFNTCSLFAEFPNWMPLDKWIPWMFNPTGDCSERQWAFLGWEMPQWLVLIFGCYLAVAIIIMLGNLGKARCCQ